MSEAANRETVERLIEGLNTRDLELFHAQFHDDSVMEYPQSGERIVGGENRRGAYGAFPGLPKVMPREIRVIVKPTEVDDDEAALLSHEIAREIEDNLEYPGQVKVTVIRESRAVDVAR